MKKIGLLKNNKMGEYEKQEGYASYRTLMEFYVGDMVLCNNIVNIDPSVYDNMNNNGISYYDYETGEEKTEEEYNNDESGKIEVQYPEIYQYFVCHLHEYDVERLTQAGVILSYSDMLECDVICVDHLGTSWDYVLTDVRFFDNYEDLKKYEESEED